MGHAGGQKADARQLLATDHLTGPLLHLPVEIVAGLLEPFRHVVECVGEFGHLVMRVELDTVSKITSSDAA